MIAQTTMLPDRKNTTVPGESDVDTADIRIYAEFVSTELQRLVDNLGRRLGRSVAIDDPDIHLLAYNSHSGEVDPVRVESIMRRKVSREVVRYLRERGISQATEMFTVPPNPELGMVVTRVGMPVRYDGTLLGFLWLVLSDGPVTDTEAAGLHHAAEQAALILHREYLIGEVSRGRERELARDLIDDDPHVRQDAADRLIEEELIKPGVTVALVVMFTQDPHDVGDKQRLALAAGLRAGRQRLLPGASLQLERPSHGILIATMPTAPADHGLDDFAELVHKRVCSESGLAEQECWVGIGQPQPRLADAHASYAQARRAAEVARIVRVFGSTVRYANLGVYGLLAEVSPERLAGGLHPGMRELLAHDDGADGLVHTLETFLDNAGSVQRAAEQLCVHRASLYYRLRRVQEITGTELSNGDDRLALHLSLKVARLIALR